MCALILATGFCPRFSKSFATLKRGRREDRVHAAPAVSCAIGQQKHAHEHTGSAETLRPSQRNGFTAYTRSPWWPCCATIASVMRSIIANLTPALVRQDHTISPSATCRPSTRQSTWRHCRVHRIPHPTFRDGHDTPLFGARDGADYTGDLGGTQELFLEFGSPSMRSLCREMIPFNTLV